MRNRTKLGTEFLRELAQLYVQNVPFFRVEIALGRGEPGVVGRGCVACVALPYSCARAAAGSRLTVPY